MIYYIADTHFGHANILKHDHRPFENTEEMDTTLINNWNERVKTNDDVYIIGDLCFRNADHPEEWYLKRLNGRKHLIIGNHDKSLLRNEKAMSYFYSVDTIKKIIDGDQDIILCHFPLAEWDGFYRGTLHIYGHIHNNISPTSIYMESLYNAYNAGCMLNGYKPVTLRELRHNKGSVAKNIYEANA